RARSVLASGHAPPLRVLAFDGRSHVEGMRTHVPVQLSRWTNETELVDENARGVAELLTMIQPLAAQPHSLQLARPEGAIHVDHREIAVVPRSEVVDREPGFMPPRILEALIIKRDKRRLSDRSKEDVRQLERRRRRSTTVGVAIDPTLR